MEPQEYAQMFALEERHWWYRALRRRIFQATDRWFAPPSAPASVPRRCLDAGCGTGMNLVALRARGGAGQEWFGLDFSTQALRLARERGLAGRLSRASIEALPHADESLDLIVAADVLYHRGVADDRTALREMSRCLKPGGLAVINLPAFGWLRSAHDEIIHTARRYTRGEVEEKLRQAGFTPVQVCYWNWLLFAPLALVRLLRRPASAAKGKRAAQPATAVCGPRSDLVATPGWANTLLDGLLAAEAALAWLPVPAGLSILTVARKGAPRGSG